MPEGAAGEGGVRRYDVTDHMVVVVPQTGTEQAIAIGRRLAGG